MSTHNVIKRQTIRDISAYKKSDKAMVCLTAYTAPVAKLADKHADLILVGDSLGMVIYGFDSTLPVTLDMMVAHGRAVVNATAQALITVDLPFGSYQESPAQAFQSAARLMAETGCQAIKLEGGMEMAETVSFLTARGVPVMGHIGLQPQSVHGMGGYRVTGRKEDERVKILNDARALTDAGAFAIVLECMDAALAAEVTAQVAVPTIGIGASAACDGQILVCDDMMGLSGGPLPRFVKSYADAGQVIDDAFACYAGEVRSRRFPSEEYTYQAGAKKTLRTVDK
jgi:3-methyl-2-oxobutanoate hydroxymethyltransferase